MPHFITGPAGTGKSYIVRGRAANNEATLTASTGVAAVNLNTRTVHSLVGFFNEDDLAHKLGTYKIHKKLGDLMRDGDLINTLVIDEVSMLSARTLDLLHGAVKYATNDKIDLTLVGDFCQLPPVIGEFAFKAKCWHEYAENTTKLTKVWRQEDDRYLEALNLARAGKGFECVEVLKSLGVKFVKRADLDAPGIVLTPTNYEVDALNGIKFATLREAEKTFGVYHMSDQIPDWKLITPVTLKIGAKVMILANDVPDFRYANGDTGTVLDIGDEHVDVLLDRTGFPVTVYDVTRRNRRDGREVGTIRFMPLRLAWASTIHKTQSLTLSHAQVDVHHPFAGAPAIMYVALSRLRSSKGLVIVGPEKFLARNIATHKEVTPWI